MSRAALPLLAALALALAALIGLELRPVSAEEDGMQALTTRVAAPRQGPAMAAPADHRQAWVETILARPLFAPDRRAPAAAAGSGAPQPALPRVAGILVEGSRRSVIFAGTGEGRSVVVAEGAELNGYRVQSIDAGQVIVSGPGGVQVLRPSFDPRPSAAPAAGPAAPGRSGLPGLPGFSGLQNLGGIPGLPPPAPSAR